MDSAPPRLAPLEHWLITNRSHLADFSRRTCRSRHVHIELLVEVPETELTWSQSTLILANAARLSHALFGLSNAELCREAGENPARDAAVLHWLTQLVDVLGTLIDAPPFSLEISTRRDGRVDRKVSEAATMLLHGAREAVLACVVLHNAPPSAEA